MFKGLASLLAGLFLLSPSDGADAEAPRKAITIRVIDSVSRSDISGAEVSVRPSASEIQKIGLTVNGRLEYRPANDDKMIELFAEANGYRKGSLFAPAVGLVEIALTPADIRGVVIAPTGQLVSGATVVAASPRSPPMLMQERKRGGWTIGSGVMTRSGLQGSFTLQLPADATALIVVHDLGCGSVPLLGWTNGSRIQLRPWTALVGRMLINGTPAANQGVIATSCFFPESDASIHITGPTPIEAVTDAQGRFALEHLPTGEIQLAWKIPFGPRGWSYSHPARFMADSANPAPALYKLNGRDVSGQFEISGAEDAWIGIESHLHLFEAPSPGLDDFLPTAAAHITPKMFVLSVTEKGEFSGTAIPPGDYGIQMFTFDAGRAQRRIHGRLIVPAGTGATNLGKITVTNTFMKR